METKYIAAPPSTTRTTKTVPPRKTSNEKRISPEKRILKRERIFRSRHSVAASGSAFCILRASECARVCLAHNTVYTVFDIRETGQTMHMRRTWRNTTKIQWNKIYLMYSLVSLAMSARSGNGVTSWCVFHAPFNCSRLTASRSFECDLSAI